jgi:serpin B
MNIPFYRGNGFRAVAMQYSDLQSRMIIVFPDGDFLQFQQDLDPEMLEEVVGGMSTREVAVVMPPFEFDTDYSLTPVLGEMGMGDAFDASRADFSGFTGERDLFITAVVHKAFVKVDETGTEAAAATGLIMATTAMPSDPPELFLLDRPFVFLIIDDRSDTVLFMGRVTDPSL